MGCGSSTSVKVAPIIPMASTASDPEGHKKLAFVNKDQVNEVKQADITDEERSRTSTPHTQLDRETLDTPSHRESELREQASVAAEVLVTDSPDGKTQSLYPKADGEQLPSVAEPLPAPNDVDSMVLPLRNDALPHWEREEGASAATPAFSSKRPGSSSGRIVVYKTEKSKKMEEEAKKKRNKSKEAGSDSKSRKLPPLKEWKKKCMNQEEAGSQWLSQSEMGR
mmetsp:Transcript_8608/g.19457  ORF Transcript_8608/g.19457 Transcript_8608/m.19457 type:complete len:224 (-) Transcript_8608:1862-2533(-)